MKPVFNKIPAEPGVYFFYDIKGVLLYIGKAKNLRNRLRSYWSKGNDLAPDKAQMVASIHTVDWIVVHTETEALLLEAGLIKKHQPPFNIVMRDDKNWTYVVIINEALPRIITVRGNTKRNGDYFGPYTNAGEAKTIVRLIHKIIPLRTCKRDLSKLPNGRVCMQYHLGNCLGPCEKFITERRYSDMIEQAREILKGNVTHMIKNFTEEMNAESKKQQYEKAAAFRNKIRALNAIRNKQYIVHPLSTNQDVIGVAAENKKATISVMQIRHGQLLDTLHFTFDNALNISENKIIESFLPQYYANLASPPKQVLVYKAISPVVQRSLTPIQICIPQRGAKKKLLKLAQKNAWIHMHRLTKTEPSIDQLYAIKEILSLPELPIRIEAYDISNISGEFAVGAMVVAHNGRLIRSDYRKFRIKTVTGANDVAMLREVITRRQNHPEWPDPQLIVLDGGKPQLNAVYPILKKEWRDRVVALAKREEELFLPGRKMSIKLPKTSRESLLLRKIRDAVHKQAVMYYRKRHRASSRS